MAKYDYIKLNLNDKELIGLDNLKDDQKKMLQEGYVVYIYRSTRTKKIYIGQTKQFLTRNEDHHREKDQIFKNTKFDEVIILISGEYFNKTVLDDVERQLITYFLADNTSRKKNMVQYDSYELLNRTQGNSVLPYAKQAMIMTEILFPFWSKDLYSLKWVNAKTIDEIKEQALIIYSPFKVLTEQQKNILNEILNNSTESFVINGDAGTGKTVLLTHLVAELLTKTNKKIAVVVQPNWEDTAKSIFKTYFHNREIVFSSYKLIDKQEKYDVIIVDESHKLSRYHPKQINKLNNVYKGKFIDKQNYLDCIKDLGTQIILMYDNFQGIRPANITRQQFKESTEGFRYHYLKTQLRIKTPKDKTYTSDDYINGIKYLLYKDTGLLNDKNFDSKFDRSVFNDKNLDAYFGYYDDRPLYNLIEWIENDRNYSKVNGTTNRILGGLVEPWKLKHGKDPSIMHWFEGGIERRWNSTQENWVNSEDNGAEDQIGSVFAVQGIDLNKVGVLIGNDLQVDENGKLYGEPKNFYNVNGKFSKKDENPTNEFEFTLFVLNIYYVLLTRGVDGIRVGFWHNDAFKDYMKKTLEID